MVSRELAAKGVDFVKAALAAGHAVVASGRDRDRVAKALSASDDLLIVTLDVTKPADAAAAVYAAVDRFGRIDVLVNNPASFYAGYFVELTPEQMERQLAASLIGPMNVTTCASSYAQSALRAHYCDFLDCRTRRFRVWYRVRRFEVRPRGVDGVAARGSRAVWHHDDRRESGLLPHGTPYGAIHKLRSADNQRL